MYCRSLLLISSVFILFSCAQVGTITGGDKDEVAPRIISSTIESGDLNVEVRQLKIVFDERIVLSKPNETSILMPNDAQLSFEYKNRSLLIFWDKPLKSNTTYSISLNGTIKDFHEGNDSLYQWIFSTGADIDSAKHIVQLKDAISSKPIAKTTIGLYRSIEDSIPRYFGRTNTKGFVNINAIKPGKYWIRAFLDENKNLYNDPKEKQGMFFNEILIENQKVDSSELLLSIPQFENEKPIMEYIPPGLIAIRAKELKEVELTASSNKIPIIIRNKFQLQDDSVIYGIPSNVDSISLEYKFDTISLELSKRDKEKPISLVHKEVKNGNTDTLFFQCSDALISVDTSKIMYILDSDTLHPSAKIEFNRLLIFNLPKSSGKFTLEFLKDAIKGQSGNSNQNKKEILTRRLTEELGVFIFHRDSSNSIIIQLLKNGKIVSEQFGLKNEFIFNNVLPGNYQIRVIDDENQNGQWDALDIKNKRQAEIVRTSEKVIAARANWEIRKNINQLFSP